MSGPGDSYEYIQIESAMILAGCSLDTVNAVIVECRKLYQRSNGYHALGVTLKVWKSTVIDIMSRRKPTIEDDSCSIYCSRVLERSQHLLRRFGWSDAEITAAVVAHGRRRIPPFLLDRAVSDVLKVNPTFEACRRVAPFANLSRAGPDGRGPETDLALSGFQRNVTAVPEWSFDYSRAVCRMLRLHGFRGSAKSRWEVSGKASREFTRLEGGKLEDFVVNYINRFRYLPVSDFVSEVVVDADLYDLTGTLVLRRGYDLDSNFCDVAYPNVGTVSTEVVDARLGHLGLFWALTELRSSDELSFDSDEDFVNLGRGRKPSLRITGGSIDSRVSAVPQPGLKVRVITITSFFVSLIGSVSRHCVDDSILALDQAVRIGLTSKVKLYDWLVFLNGDSHLGVSSCQFNALPFEIAVSVDLTTATDTPDRGATRSLLQGVADSIQGSACQAIFQLGVDLAGVPRRFELSDSVTIESHNCGIMMGEGLSGIFLNVASAFVRYSVNEFRVALSDYRGNSVADADAFIRKNVQRIQEVIESLRFDSPIRSIQSGDDMSSLGYEQISRFLILVYRTFNFFPSEGSWYESNNFLTFTEEIAIKTEDSNGWTFVDCVKPRLFRCLDRSGEDAVASRVKQIGDSLRYLDSHVTRERLLPLVDRMIHSCESLQRVISTHGIPVGLPTWLGGLGHPVGDEPGYLLTVDQRYRDLLLYLSECGHERISEVICIGDTTKIDGDGRDELINLICAMQVGTERTCLGELDGTDWISVTSLDVPRMPTEKYGFWQKRKMSYAQANGLVTIADFCSWYQSVNNTRNRLCGTPQGEVSIAYRLRKKQEFLFSLIPEEYVDSSASTDEDIFAVFREMSAVLGSRYWKRESLILELGLDTLPNFSVCFSAV